LRELREEPVLHPGRDHGVDLPDAGAPREDLQQVLVDAPTPEQR
jgi:hypothetical protein